MKIPQGYRELNHGEAVLPTDTVQWTDGAIDKPASEYNYRAPVIYGESRGWEHTPTSTWRVIRKISMNIKITIPKNQTQHMKPLAALINAASKYPIFDDSIKRWEAKGGCLYRYAEGNTTTSHLDDVSYNNDKAWTHFVLPQDRDRAYIALAALIEKPAKTWQIGEHTARIEGDVLVVGCTRVPKATVLEIAEELK